MPTALSNAQCPYCDHVSPAGSKFCNDCGAALHLRPCPHCGSVNDITLSTHCSRCNGDLGFSATAEHPDVIAAAPPLDPPRLGEVMESSAPATEIAFAPEPGSAPFQKPKGPGYRTPLFVLLMLAVLGASYFALRSAPDSAPSTAKLPPAPAPIQTVERPGPAASEALVVADKEPVPAADPVTRAADPVPVPVPAQESMPAPAFAASLSKLSPPSAGNAPAARRAAPLPPAAASAYPVAQPLSQGPRLRSPGEGLNLKPPSLGNCTDAVAALGLCTPESNPRSP